MAIYLCLIHTTYNIIPRQQHTLSDSNSLTSFLFYFCTKFTQSLRLYVFSMDSQRNFLIQLDRVILFRCGWINMWFARNKHPFLSFEALCSFFLITITSRPHYHTLQMLTICLSQKNVFRLCFFTILQRLIFKEIRECPSTVNMLSQRHVEKGSVGLPLL